MDSTVVLTFILSLLITIFVYLLVPTIVILRKKEYKQSKIRRIAIINGIVCFLLFSVIQIELGGDGGNVGACLLWSFVGYWLMKQNCLLDDEEDESDN